MVEKSKTTVSEKSENDQRDISTKLTLFEFLRMSENRRKDQNLGFLSALFFESRRLLVVTVEEEVKAKYLHKCRHENRDMSNPKSISANFDMSGFQRKQLVVYIRFGCAN